MTTVVRLYPWLGCIAVCALAGCSAAQKSQSNYSYSPTPAAGNVSSTYENYTQPQPALKPIPAPPADAVDPVPPPPASQTTLDGKFDFFDSAKLPTLPKFNR